VGRCHAGNHVGRWLPWGHHASLIVRTGAESIRHGGSQSVLSRGLQHGSGLVRYVTLCTLHRMLSALEPALRDMEGSVCLEAAALGPAASAHFAPEPAGGETACDASGGLRPATNASWQAGV
jgi:hypothetical protein